MKKIFLFFILGVFASITASAQYFQWAKKQEGILEGPSIASGNSLVATTGTFFQTITIGNQTFTGTDSMNSYLAVHDHSGNVVWAKQIISPAYIQPSITMDDNQNIIIAGIYQDSLFIDGLLFKGTTLESSGIYVAKFSPTGSLLWARSSDIRPNYHPYFGYNSASSVATDASGNVFLAGSYNDLSFNGTNLNSNGKSNAYLVKYDMNGSFQWAVNAPNSLQINEGYVKIKATTTGNIYLVKQSSHQYSFPNFSFSIIKFNPSGNILWNKTESTYVEPLSLAIDNNDNAYVSGLYYNSVTIGNTTLTQNSNACFIAKLDASGNWNWVQNIITKHSSGLDSLQILSNPTLFYSPSNNELGIAGTFRGVAQFNNITISSTSASTPNTANTYIAKLDTAGTPIWANNVEGLGYISCSDLSGDQNGNFFISGRFTGNAQFSNITLSTSSWSAGYLTKVNNGTNAVSGTIFIDSNSNGIKDPSESGYSQVMLETMPGSVHGISETDGTYTIYLQQGSSTISLPNPPPSYNVVPASQSVTFSGSNQTQTGKDFALQPIPNSNDVKVTVTPFTPARPGFQSRYRLTFYNAGTTVLSDTLKFSHDTSTLTFVSTSEPTLSNSNGKMVWYYQNLQPNETRNIDVTFSVPTTTVLGTPLQAIASIKPFAIDLFQEDNIDTLNHVVVGSFDPNDKQVDKTTLSPTAAANGEYLDYTIRFQNTGTDTAFTVVVTDRILSQLNLGDFEMLSASHAYKLTVIDGNMLEWRFDNILLPDSNRNEPASHGFIRFRLKSKAGLLPGDSISNQAAIYFDYNAPVITNYAVTKVANPMSVKDARSNIQAFKLYPNPARNYVMVAADFKKNTAATVSLVNLLGQTLSKATLPANNQIHYQLPLNDLPKGVYLIRLETETGMQTQRLVIQ